ncbi:recombinase family protein [Brevundimonas viscosa]
MQAEAERATIIPERIVCETTCDSVEKQWLARIEIQSQNRGMEIGYARVSTGDQNLDLQEQALRGAGVEKLYSDRASGGAVSRPGLDQALSALKPGDVLVVWRLDRLGRSLPHLIDVVSALGAKGIGFRSLADGIDTTTAQGKLVFHLMGALAEFERALISERTQAGLRAAKARGARLGRRPVLAPAQIAHAQKLVADGESPTAVARTLQVGRATLYRALRAAEQNRPGDLASRLSRRNSKVRSDQ